MFWDTETLGIEKDTQTSNLSKEESNAQLLQDSVTFYHEGEKCWYTSLLWKQDPPQLGSNKFRALAVMRQVELQAKKKGTEEAINASIQELVDNGFAEEVVEDEEPEQVHYLQGHAVYREDHDTTKTRFVLNGAAITESGKSINQCLYQGRCLLPEINHVLIRWRMNLIAFVLDISKMFLRIKLLKGTDYLRFFWRFCEKNTSPKIFRMLCVTFGMISSPFQAIDVVMKHADRVGEKLPLAAEEIRLQIYMDDVPGGANHLEVARQKILELWEFFQSASMMPHKFASNFPEILESIPTANTNPKTLIKVLGVLWNTEQDLIMFNITLPERKEHFDTKRSFLETSAVIFDPLGLLSPFVMKIKLLFQKVWLAEEKETIKAKKGWDSPLSKDIQQEWDKIKTEIETLNEIKIARCFFNHEQKQPKDIELFCFGDASIKSYATAIYMVGTHEDGSASTNLVLSKSRIAPKKMVEAQEEGLSIVRLELLAAVITVRAAQYVLAALEKQYKVKAVHYFTDSLINHCRIIQPATKYKIWEANRLEEILKSTKPAQWHHCAGEHNPADLPSRGLSAKELKASTMWWKGPTFMVKPQSEWPTEAEYELTDDPAVKKEGVLKIDFKELFASSVQKVDDEKFRFVLKLMMRFETWFSSIRFLSKILRCHPKNEYRRKEFSLEEKKKTEDFLWSFIQRFHMKTDFERLQSGLSLQEKSKILVHNPFLDSVTNVMKSNSRLALSGLPQETKNAIILPKDCPIVEKFIMDQHKLHQHAKTGYLHSLLRQRFVLPSGRQQIRKAIRKCTTRKCVEPVRLEQQLAPLPDLRTDDPVPFKNVAVDLFGPLMVYHKCEAENCPHSKEQKVHVALFTCFHSRAVHLELVMTTGTEDFLNAFRLFTARRGMPENIYSDNAKGFKAADKELRKLYRSIKWKKVHEDGIKRSINWFFSCEKASHQNGLCERLVRTVKTPLKIAVGSARLTIAQLRITLTEIEAVVNNRPLGVTSNDSNDFVPITPFELFGGRRLDQVEDPNNRQNVTNFQQLWRKRASVLNSFWKRWSHSYLLEQQVRNRWKTPSREDLMGKIVLIRDDEKLSRNLWRFGRIIEIHPSKDGLIRNVTVKTQESVLRRPVQKLALFENY